MAPPTKVNTAEDKQEVREPRLGQHVLRDKRTSSAYAPNTGKLNSLRLAAAAAETVSNEAKPLSTPSLPPVPRSLFAFALALAFAFRRGRLQGKPTVLVDVVTVLGMQSLNRVRVEVGAIALFIVARSSLEVLLTV